MPRSSEFWRSCSKGNINGGGGGISGAAKKKMPTRHKISKTERRLLVQSWQAVAGENNDNPKVHATINEAWLYATEQSPKWVWGVIGVSESVEGGAAEHPKFKGLIQQIVTFICHGVTMLQAGKDSRYAACCQQLGLRHRHYFYEGQRPAYWVVFCRELRNAIQKLMAEHIASDDCQTSTLYLSVDGGDGNDDGCSEPGGSSIDGISGVISPSSAVETCETSVPPQPAPTSSNCSTGNSNNKRTVNVQRVKSAPGCRTLGGSGKPPMIKKADSSDRQRQNAAEKLRKAWDTFLDLTMDNIRLGYCGNCAKPGGSVGGTLMNMLSMSGMMGNVRQPLGDNANSKHSGTPIAAIIRPPKLSSVGRQRTQDSNRLRYDQGRPRAGSGI